MDLILLLSVLLVVPFILLKACKRRNICLHKLISSGEFQFGIRICSEWLCAYTGLRNWPGSKPWFPLFICRSGLLKVKLTLGPYPWPPPGGFKGRQPQGQQSFTSFHKSLPGREISKVHFEPSAWDLPAICHWHQAITGTQRGRRTERGRALPGHQDHHLCISHC